MARAITSEELIKLRSDGQGARLYLAIDNPGTVFSARVNQASFTDGTVQVIYDGGVGTYTNIKVGMTVLVGSAAGLCDLGRARVRKAATSTILYLGENSDIAWANDLYLTVVDEFALWARHLRVTSKKTYMDWEIAYTDQHKYPDPVPILGTDRVFWLGGATVEDVRDGSASWVPGGGTITGYNWTAAGASATSGLTTATPTITYDAAGRYLVSCTVTGSNGKTATGWRTNYVFDPAHMPTVVAELGSCEGGWDSGGWEFKVGLVEGAGLEDVRDGVKVTLFSRDNYGSSAGSIGPVDGSENIIAMGWIAGETIEWAPSGGGVSFTVKGPAGMMGKMPSFPTGIINKHGADPTKWTEFRDLTVDKACWSFLHWRTTATMILDVVLSGDTRSIPTAESPQKGLWGQLADFCESMILARPLSDRYGRIFVEVDTQVTPVASRSAIAVVMAVTEGDRGSEISLERSSCYPVGMLEISGMSYNGTKSTGLFSKAPGNAPKSTGDYQTSDNLIFASQAQANQICGDMLAWMNCEWPNVDIQLEQNNRFIDICPRQLVSMTIGAGETLRGMSWSDKRMIPRSVSHAWSSGALTTEITGEVETVGTAGITVIKPATPIMSPGVSVVPTPPAIEPTPFPNLPDITPNPSWAPEDGLPCRDNPLVAGVNGPFDTWITGTLSGNASSFSGTPGETSTFQAFHAWVRPATAENRSGYVIVGDFQSFNVISGQWEYTESDDWYTVYLCDASGNRIATGVHDVVIDTAWRTGYFDAPIGMEFYMLEIVVSVDDINDIADLVTGSLVVQADSHPWNNTVTFTYALYPNGHAIEFIATCHYHFGVKYPTVTGVYLNPKAGKSFANTYMTWKLISGHWKNVGGEMLTVDTVSVDKDWYTQVEIINAGGLPEYTKTNWTVTWKEDHAGAECDYRMTPPFGGSVEAFYDIEIRGTVYMTASHQIVVSKMTLNNLCQGAL